MDWFEIVASTIDFRTVNGIFIILWPIAYLAFRENDRKTLIAYYLAQAIAMPAALVFEGGNRPISARIGLGLVPVIFNFVSLYLMARYIDLPYVEKCARQLKILMFNKPDDRRK